MTVLLGPTPCHGCKTPVTIVRRPVMIHDSHGSNQTASKDNAVPSDELREVVPVGADGEDHRCA